MLNKFVSPYMIIRAPNQINRFLYIVQKGFPVLFHCKGSAFQSN